MSFIIPTSHLPHSPTHKVYNHAEHSKLLAAGDSADNTEAQTLDESELVRRSITMSRSLSAAQV